MSEQDLPFHDYKWPAAGPFRLEDCQMNNLSPVLLKRPPVNREEKRGMMRQLVKFANQITEVEEDFLDALWEMEAEEGTKSYKELYVEYAEQFLAVCKRQAVGIKNGKYKWKEAQPNLQYFELKYGPQEKK